MKKLIVLALAAVSMSAQAADWYFLNTSNRNAAHYFDAATIIRNGSQIDVWMKNARLFSPNPSTQAWTVTVRWRIDCAARTLQSLSSSWHDEKDGLLFSENKVGALSLIAPESAADAWHAMLCDKQFPRPQSDQYFKVANLSVFHNVVRQAYSEVK